MAQHEEDLIQFDEPPRFRDIKLPSFWSDRPASWFALAEARFRSHNIGGEQAKFDHVVGALSKESIGRVLDLVEVPPLFNPYTALKARLLDAHQLTDYQRVDQLLKMGDLGARRPSELLAAMLELCPRGQETSLFFTHLFLCRLPAELRIMLGEDDHQDVRLLITKADKLWAMHGQKSNLVAAVDQPEEADPSLLAAFAARGRGGQGGRGRGRGQHTSSRGQQQPGNHNRGQQQRQQPQQSAGGQSAVAPTTPSDIARMGSDLCWNHWTYGEKANKCVAPCGWQGN